MDVSNGDPYTLCHFSFGNHTSTHIDFPSHIIAGGKSSSDYPLSYLVGTGKVIEIPDDGHVQPEHLSEDNIHDGDIIFFKTQNTRKQLQEKNNFTNNFSALSPEAAQKLVNLGVKIVGIDYLSIDKAGDDTLPVHNTLLQHGILIVENINLQGVNPGQYFFNISPLKIEHADGLPVRISATSINL